MKQFTVIKGDFSERRELPRLGKIRLGLKVRNQGGKEYPTETEYFVCPDEVREVYGDTPTSFDVLLPSNKRADILRSKYAMYGSGSGLKCHGDGEEAERFNEQTQAWESRTCPCEFLKTDQNPKGLCTPKSDLMVMLPLVSMGGCYQIKTGSAAATKNINSSLDLIEQLTGGRIAFLPMKLRRVPTEMTHQGFKRTHYIMTLTLNANWQETLELRQRPNAVVIPQEYRIAAPTDENPELDPPDQVVVDAEDVAEMDEAQLKDVQAKLAAQREGAAGAPVTAPANAGLASATAAAPSSAPEYATVPKQKKPQLTMVPETHDAASSWAEIVSYIDANPELCTFKADWKIEHNVTNVIRLNAVGQQELLQYLREKVPGFPY